MYVEFDWDEEKAASNLRKHGIGFEAAQFAFFDPSAILEQDRIVGGEARWRLLGRTDLGDLLVIAHISEDEQGVERIRIISARKAIRKEKAQYERENRETSGRSF